MKRMLRLVAVVIVLALSVGMLAGCGTGGSDKNENGQTVLSVGCWPSKEGEWMDTLNARKARFEESNPDVVIEPNTWTFDRKTFYAKAAGGQLPNLYEAGFTEVPEIIDSEYSADLTDALKKRGFLDKMNEDIIAMASKEGRVKVLPKQAYVLGIAYNVDLFKETGLMEEDGTPKQPKNWNELVKFAVQIKNKTGKPGFVFPTANRSGGWIFTSLAWSYGVNFMKKDADGTWKATFNTPEAAEALQFIKDLKWKYDVLPANALIDGKEYYKTFGTGGAAMLITAGDVPKKLTAYGMMPEQFGMMALPAGPKRHVTLLGGDVYAVNNTATKDQVDAAIRWIETEFNPNLTEEVKFNQEEGIKSSLQDNQQIGIKSMSVWNENSELLQYQRQLIDEYTNVNPNYVRLYNEFVAECPCEIQAEEPVCCQELYAILDGCLQEVLTNQDADPATLLEKANSDFQVNYLNDL